MAPQLSRNNAIHAQELMLLQYSDRYIELNWGAVHTCSLGDMMQLTFSVHLKVWA